MTRFRSVAAGLCSLPAGARSLACLAAVVSLAGCGGTASENPTPVEVPELLLTFDDRTAGPADAPVVTNEGSASAQIDIVTVGKSAVSFADRPSQGTALVLPAYSGKPSGPFAGIRVSGASWLSPGDRNFGFGADVKLNETSRGTEVDNGDNVVQRGLFGDPAQFKIQVDKRRPSCVIRGTAGTLTVKSKVVLGSGWYQLRCERTGSDRVTFTVTDLDSGNAPEVTDATGPLGQITMADTTPLSIGAKTAGDGKLAVSSTDQFNGEIDNVTYTIPNS